MIISEERQMSKLCIQDTERLFLPSGLEWLGIDIRGLQLNEVDHLCVWPYRPVPVGESDSYDYGPISREPSKGGECHNRNSIRIRESGHFVLQDELDSRSDPARVWVCVDISGIDLKSAEFLLLYTECLGLPGWRSRIW